MGSMAVILATALVASGLALGTGATSAAACTDPANTAGVNVELAPRGSLLDVGGSESFNASVWCYAPDGTATDVTSQSSVTWDLQAPIGVLSSNSGISTTFTATANGSGPLFARADYAGMLGEGAAWIDVGAPPPPPPPTCAVGGGSQGAPGVAGLMVIIDPGQARLDISQSQSFSATVFRCDANGAMLDVTSTSTISWALGVAIGSLSSSSGVSTTFTASSNGSTELVAHAVEGNDAGDGFSWIAVGADGGWGCAIAGGGNGGLPTPGPGGGSGGTGPGPAPPPGFALMVLVEPGDAYLQIGDTVSFLATVYFCDAQGALHDVTTNSTIGWTAPQALGSATTLDGPSTTFTASANGSDLLQATATYGNESGFGGAWISVGAVGG
ncbi:MAG TPA: hypothetical protein VI893_08805, partial [Thermoplasmata archaeon]|nr:hypothetical protein [Thermoplasmata archaeon]